MASNGQEEQEEVRIPDEVLFGPEVDEEHYNSCDEDDDEQLLVTEASEEDYRAIRKVWEMEAASQTILNIDENGEENGAKNQNEAEEEDDNEDNEKPRAKTSMADPYFKKERLVWFSFDVETIKSGMVQISCTCTRFTRTGEAEKEAEEFNKYVNPGDYAIWDDRSFAVHGLHKYDSRIEDADDIETVWNQFCEYVNRHIGKSQRGVLVAWRGESCDMTWIYKLCQAPFSKLSLPNKLSFFMDPSKVIHNYKSCKLNHGNTGNDTYALGEVWKTVTKKNDLENAHDSIVDCRAQMDILCSKEFKPFLNKTNSIKTIAEIISKKEQNELNKDSESVRPVHMSWRELLNPFSWIPSKGDSYSGPSGSGQAGASTSITSLIATTTSLAIIFFAFFPLSVFEKITRETKRYAYEDNVEETEVTDRDGKKKKKKRLLPSKKKRGNGVRKRATKEAVKFPITLGFVIAWIGVLILHGAMGGRLNYWRQMPYGRGYPPIQNAMNRDAFNFMRRYIHFENNVRKKGSGPKDPLYEPLFKIKWVLDEMMKAQSKQWVAGEHVTIDESMIKYMGKAIDFVQYNPMKPIKHGIKVFALCCSKTAYMLGFEVYVGKDRHKDGGSAFNVVERLIRTAGLNVHKGRTLFIDNWYSSIGLAEFLYDKYRWTVVGTIVPTQKKARDSKDPPFLKLSNGALRKVERGWFREAVMEVKTARGNKYYIQCTTWRDKKQVMFVHTKAVGRTEAGKVLRHVKGKSKRVSLKAPNVQKIYANNFNAVDRNDRDSADYSTSIRTNRWYLRIFFWLLDRAIFAMYIVLIDYYEDTGDERFKRYAADGGRYMFQIDLGLALLDYGIREDWPLDNDETWDLSKRPRWMRGKEVIPCDCVGPAKCFFCTEGITNGVYHDRSKMKFHSPGSGKKRQIGVQCTMIRWALPDYKKCRPCKQCRSKPKGQKRFYSTMGCPRCNQPICQHCWKDGYNNDGHRPFLTSKLKTS